MTHTKITRSICDEIARRYVSHIRKGETPKFGNIWVKDKSFIFSELEKASDNPDTLDLGITSIGISNYCKLHKGYTIQNVSDYLYYSYKLRNA